MRKNITSLGQKEAEFLALVSSKNNQQFNIEGAIQFGGSSVMAKKRLYQLERKGWVARLERGKYMVIPLEAGPERKWSEDSYLVANAMNLSR